MPLDIITWAKTPHLDSNHQIPRKYLPDYGDVKEFPTFADFPSEGEENVSYVALDTQDVYRWSTKINQYYIIQSKRGMVTDVFAPHRNTTTGKWEFLETDVPATGAVTLNFANSDTTVGTVAWNKNAGLVAVEDTDTSASDVTTNVNGLFMTSLSSDINQNTNISVYPASRYMLRNHANFLPTLADKDDTDGSEKYTDKSKRAITIGNLEEAIKYGLGHYNKITFSPDTGSIYDPVTVETDWTLREQVVACDTIGANYHTDVKYDGSSLNINVKSPSEAKPYYALASRVDFGISSRSNNDPWLATSAGGYNEQGRIELGLKEATQRELRVKGDENVERTYPETYTKDGVTVNTGTNNAVTSRNVDEAVKSALAYFNAKSVKKSDGSGAYVLPDVKKVSTYTGDVLTATKGSYTLEDALYIDESEWDNGYGEQTRANITIGSVKDAVVWDTSAGLGYPTEGIPLRIADVDEYRRLKLNLAKAAELKSGSTTEYTYKNAFGLVAPTRLKGLRFTKQDETKEDADTNIYQGRLQVDETRQKYGDTTPVKPKSYDDDKWTHNDILWRVGRDDVHNTGNEDLLSTKVLTTKYIDEIFKYGLGHFKYNDDDYKEYWLTGGKDDGYDAEYDEKFTARRTIAAQKLIKIKVLA